MEKKTLITPLNNEQVMKVKSGDRVIISGEIYTARDAAHKRLVEMITRGEDLPVELNGNVFFYAGPTPAKPGCIVGSIGPTGSSRLDYYTPTLLSYGLKACIGKGSRNEETRKALKKYKGIYLTVTGGVAALIAQKIKEIEVIAFEELGTEALQRVVVDELPAIVINDTLGNDYYEEVRLKYYRN